LLIKANIMPKHDPKLYNKEICISTNNSKSITD
jgi:hypothetical protein